MPSSLYRADGFAKDGIVSPFKASSPGARSGVAGVSICDVGERAHQAAASPSSGTANERFNLKHASPDKERSARRAAFSSRSSNSASTATLICCLAWSPAMGGPTNCSARDLPCGTHYFTLRPLVNITHES
jgi:hypothetical protein